MTDLHHERSRSPARRLEHSIIGICDTNVDLTLVTYPVPANDDAVKSVKLIVDYIAACVTLRSNVAKEANAETAKSSTAPMSKRSPRTKGSK